MPNPDEHDSRHSRPSSLRASTPQEAALSFATVVEEYDRGRPAYPVEAAAWATGSNVATVVELGAGTGKLTDRLVELGFPPAVEYHL